MINFKKKEPLAKQKQVQIRQLVKKDLPALEWGGEYTHFRRIFADAYDRALRGLSVLWVAELPDVGIVGQVFVQLTCDRPELANGVLRAYFYSFRVKPEYRSQGIGSDILQVLEEDLQNRGYQEVTLNVAKDNQRVQKFYQHQGYKIIAHEPGQWSYQDPDGTWHEVDEPAWRMMKRIR